jgi:hypothetical protein
MDGLLRNYKLEELNLKKNCLRLLSAKRIAEVLNSPSNQLSTLLLSDNFFGDEGGKLII